MGTPRFGAIILEWLAQYGNGEIRGVFTRPDKQSGRGLKTVHSDVKRLALELGLPVFQPASLGGDDAFQLMRSLKPDFIISAAYGLLIPQRILDVPSLAPLNVHGSYLPEYRGAAPIQRAIMDKWGENAWTGVSIMKMVRELDAGPVYAQKKIPLARHDSATLTETMANEGALLLNQVMAGLARGDLEPVEQDHAKATYAARITREDGRVDWLRPVEEVDAKIRAVTPFPGATATFRFVGRDKSINVKLRGGLINRMEKADKPGLIKRCRGSIGVSCANGLYELETVIPEGRKPMPAADFVNGQTSIKEGICGEAWTPDG